MFLVAIIMQNRYIKELEEDLDDAMQQKIDYKHRVSMIIYHLRAYREGANGFTILRKIEDIVKKYE